MENDRDEICKRVVSKMKKKIILIICVIGFLLGCFLVIEFLRYRFGYFVKGPKMEYEHNAASFLKLEDGNVLVVGANYINWEKKLTYIPAEIYDYKINKFKTKDMPKSIFYFSNGLLLKNNRLLLTRVADPKELVFPVDKFGKKSENFLYDKMAILDLNTMKIEKMLKKTLLEDGGNADFALLGDDKVFILHDTSCKDAVEIINLKNNISNILPLKKGHYGSKLVAINDVEILLFNTDGKVEKYDDTKKEVYEVGSILSREDFVIKRANEEEIILLGGCGGEKNLNARGNEIEVYNIRTNTSNIIGSLLTRRSPVSSRSAFKPGIGIMDDNIIITGGSCPFYYDFCIAPISAEVINYKHQSQTMLRKTLFGIDIMENIIKLNNGNMLILGSSKETKLFKNKSNK